MITAISNDIDYKKIFTYQRLESFASKGDLFIAFSCSDHPKILLMPCYLQKEKN